MKKFLKGALTVATVAFVAQAAAQVTFHEREGFQGRTFTTERAVVNFDRYGFNDRASSVVVLRDRWEVCSDADFSGRCVVLRPGRYGSLAEMGMNDRASSARLVGRNVRVSDERFMPVPVPVYDNHRRPSERLYQAEVTSVRAVLGRPEQRCWVEREQVVAEQRGDVNVGGAIVGALLGGVLGHQVGGGRGKDIATAGGAVAGAALGANVGRDGGQPAITRDVRRCETVPSQSRPDYWDVSYVFRDQEHHIQMVSPPGRTITVNRLGEPRA